MVKVIKRKGKIVAFSAAKIKRGVANSAKDAKLPVSVRKRLVRKIALPIIRSMRRRKLVRTSAIRKSILSKLNRQSKAAAQAWRKYERR